MDRTDGGLSRRRLLRLGALGGVAALAGACGASRPQSTGSTRPAGTTVPPTTGVPSTTGVAATTTTTVPTTTTMPVTTTSGPPTGADWAALGGQLTGRLSLPTDATYPVDLELYDPRYDGIKPAAIAYCAHADDVARSVSFARQHGLDLTARSGGHSYGGYSTTSGLVIDVSLMSAVTVDGAHKLATIGAGARLIDAYAGLSAQGLGLSAGSCPTVGLGGLSLGGGVGVVGRMYGLTCDRITALQIVTAGGEVVYASETTNADLYWACRGGGGGNFGVVTSFTFSVFPAPELALFGASWPWSAASQVLPAWLEWVSQAPDELWSNCILQTDPGGNEPSVYVGGAWVGTSSDAGSQLAALTAVVGAPSAGPALGENAFLDAMFIEAGCQGLSQQACHLAGKYPGGTLSRRVGVAKSDVVNGPLGDAGVQAMLAGIDARQSQGGPGAVAFDSWGGAINRVAPSATAFVHRRAQACAQYGANFGAAPAPADVSVAQTWMDNWYATLRPYVSGEAYQNYIDPHLAHWQQAYYGSNLARLQQVKGKWDPDNVWQFAQSIPLP